MAKGWTEDREIPWDNIHTGSEPVEPGIYAVTVSRTTPKVTDSSGRPSIAVDLQVFQKYDSEEEVNRKVKDTFTVTPEGAFKMKQFAEIADLELPERNRYDLVCDFAEEMTGVEIWANIGVREYNNRMHNQVIRYLTDDELEEAAANLKESKTGFKRRSRGKSSNGSGTEEIKDKDEDQQEQKPRKARAGKRRRAQT